jgi:hypothetical protein
MTYSFDQYLDAVSFADKEGGTILFDDLAGIWIVTIE